MFRGCPVQSLLRSTQQKNQYQRDCCSRLYCSRTRLASVTLTFPVKNLPFVRCGLLSKFFDHLFDSECPGFALSCSKCRITVGEYEMAQCRYTWQGVLCCFRQSVKAIVNEAVLGSLASSRRSAVNDNKDNWHRSWRIVVLDATYRISHYRPPTEQ